MTLYVADNLQLATLDVYLVQTGCLHPVRRLPRKLRPTTRGYYRPWHHWPDTNCELQHQRAVPAPPKPLPYKCWQLTPTFPAAIGTRPTDSQLVLPLALTGSSVLGLSCSLVNTSLDSIPSTKSPTCSLDALSLDFLQLQPSEP